ncbi:hypothetical protein KC207_11500 [Phycicoccus sp. BSK3Z-2]|uniref:DUF3558 domain-containing protein n=1 Tax=Phycicoccus avicenniae TaxID=2828860 RepID=A0A941I146_9MICO|nr:hypothetical protein [Phycicoccus avicenniae]MBR7743916.1 hypothetical protein [Phycicoccus avicenniae]
MSGYGSWRGRTAIIAVLLATLSGCARAPGGPGHDFLDLERREWGGMCAEGPCESTLGVGADGAWTFTSQRGSTTGRLTDGALLAMRRAVGSTSAAGTGDPDGNCEADADGTSVEYTWRLFEAPSETSTATSCGDGLDPEDPLVTALDDLAEDAAASLD